MPAVTHALLSQCKTDMSPIILLDRQLFKIVPSQIKGCYEVHSMHKKQMLGARSRSMYTIGPDFQIGFVQSWTRREVSPDKVAWEFHPISGSNDEFRIRCVRFKEEGGGKGGWWLYKKGNHFSLCKKEVRDQKGKDARFAIWVHKLNDWAGWTKR